MLECLVHRLTRPKGVYSLRYFLSPMRIPNLLMHVFIHTFCPPPVKCITRFGTRIGDREYLNEYTPYGSVSLCNILTWEFIFKELACRKKSITRGYTFRTSSENCWRWYLKMQFYMASCSWMQVLIVVAFSSNICPVIFPGLYWQRMCQSIWPPWSRQNNGWSHFILKITTPSSSMQSGCFYRKI